MKYLLTTLLFFSHLFGQVTLDIKVLPKGTTVILDGKEIGNAPIKGYSVKPGLHEVRLEADGYAPATHEISVQDAKRLSPTLFLLQYVRLNFGHKKKAPILNKWRTYLAKRED
jgi:PEGA domain.